MEAPLLRNDEENPSYETFKSQSILSSSSTFAMIALIAADAIAGSIIVFQLFVWSLMLTQVGSGCPYSPLSYSHRGDTSFAQENSLDALVASSGQGFATELDVFFSTDSEVVVFHDGNFLELTGNDLEIGQASWRGQVEGFEYLQVVDGVDYGQRRPVENLSNVLQQMCTQDPNAFLDIDLKGNIGKDFINAIVDLLDESPCACEVGNQFQLSTASSTVIKKIKSVLESRENVRCKPLTNIFIIGDSGRSYDHFRMRTKLWPFFVKADIYMAHYQVWESYPEVLASYGGFCTGTYGSSQSTLDDVGVSYSRIVDLGAIEESQYEGSRLMFGSLAVMFGVSVGFLVGQLLLTLLGKGTIVGRQVEKEVGGQ